MSLDVEIRAVVFIEFGSVEVEALVRMVGCIDVAQCKLIFEYYF